MRLFRTGLYMCFLASLLLSGCKDEGAPERPESAPTEQEAAVDTPPASRTELARQVRGFLADWAEQRKNFLATYTRDFKSALDEMSWFKKTVSRAYEERSYGLIFSDGIKLLPQADHLTESLGNLEDHGLDPSAYERDALVALRGSVSAAQEAYEEALKAPDGVDEGRLWAAIESLKGAELPELEKVEEALAEADLDDSHLPLVPPARSRLDTIFDMKASLNHELIAIDIALLQRWFRYVHEMRFARRAHPFLADKEYGRGLTRSSERLIEHFLATDFQNLKEELKALQPLIPEYEAMMGGLVEYRRLAEEVEQVKLAKAVQRLRKGSEGEHVTALQQRLIQEGYLEGEADGKYGAELMDAVKLYQDTHQLKQTGLVDKHTRSSLNKSFEHRARQVALALQRHRESELHQGSWRFGEIPVQGRVNIPAFQAVFYKDSKPAKKHRVVVGSNAISEDEKTGLKGYYNRTRMFSEELQTIVLNPTWKVPRRIKEQELDPMLIDEPDFYEANNYKVDIGADGSEMVTQLSGESNALGLVKFLFPNRFSIYMHDTPKKKLFQREIRAYSHGCMRTMDALDLARWILVELEDVKPERFDEILDGAEPYGISLDNRIPITIDYNTVGVHESGRMMFYLDVYKFDKDYFAGKIPYEVPEEPRFEQVVLVD